MRPRSEVPPGGAARRDEPGFITLVLRQDEAASGGMATISMPVDLWCRIAADATRTPGVATGDELAPSVELPAMIAPVRFRVRLHATK